MSTSMSTSQRTSMRTSQRIQQICQRQYQIPITYNMRQTLEAWTPVAYWNNSMEVEGLLELLLCRTISPKNIPLFYKLLKYHIIHSLQKNSLIIRKHSSKNISLAIIINLKTDTIRKHSSKNISAAIIINLKTKHISTFLCSNFRCNYYHTLNHSHIHSLYYQFLAFSL